MSEPTDFIVCSTFHEPQFRLKYLVKSALPIIKSFFSKKIVCCSSSTGIDIRSFLTNAGFQVIVNSSIKRVDVYREAIETALNYINKPQNQRILYIDFDRLIHWASKYPDDLINIINQNKHVDYLHIGRTSRAFNTHPPTQKETEIIINKISSKILGFIETKDIISVCYMFTKELGEKIVRLKNINSMGFYCTWPIFFWKWASIKRYLETEGLEWETPDRFNKEIIEIGYNKWIEQFQSPSEWRRRVNLLRDCISELSQFTEFKFYLKTKNNNKMIKKK